MRSNALRTITAVERIRALKNNSLEVAPLQSHFKGHFKGTF
jgi:hypothetical protein